MHRSIWTHLVLSSSLFLAAGTLRAQQSAPEPPPPPLMHHMGGPEQGFGWERLELLGFEGAGGHRVVKGAPFSAVAVSESTQTLADGNTIRRTTQSALYRDTEGRFRREVTLPAIGPLAASGAPRTFTSIHDPVSGTSYVLEPEQKVARKLPSHGLGAMKFFKREFGPKAAGPQDSANVTTESLGTQTMNGVNAEGTRVTHTIPAGQIGNDKPLVIVSERWYSPDLQMVVMSKRSDPRFGTTTYQLTRIQRTEPAASLFQVPSDYTVKEGGLGLGRRMRGMRQPPAPPAPPDL